MLRQQPVKRPPYQLSALDPKKSLPRDVDLVYQRRRIHAEVTGGRALEQTCLPGERSLKFISGVLKFFELHVQLHLMHLKFVHQGQRIPGGRRGGREMQQRGHGLHCTGSLGTSTSGQLRDRPQPQIGLLVGIFSIVHGHIPEWGDCNSGVKPQRWRKRDSRSFAAVMSINVMTTPSIILAKVL